MSFQNKITVEVARKIIYGGRAIERLPMVCKSLGLTSLWVVTGGTATKRIREETILPLLDSINTVNVLEISNRSYEEEIEYLLKKIQSNTGTAIIAAGGGRVMDVAKVTSCFTDIPWISIPTSASHDGFSSPFINFLLREAIKDLEKVYTPFTPTPPLAIIGDTLLISQGPYKHVVSGVGDLVAKITAVRDWELAFRLRGEYYDEYAATFGLMSARIVEEGYSLIAQAKEPGIRLVVKALGNSGVAMSIAGNSRPASGCEHLISHYLDYLAVKEQIFSNKDCTHGFQVGLATVLAMYLHGGNWENILKILKSVRHPTSFNEIGIDREILLRAILNAHQIRPNRYTILGDGLNKNAAIKAIETTGVA
ncbi:MAG: sn-glycerol-1-phosphate dehydrogenase [Candidatus Hodarchaeales archaeon]|jgi:glycerol-1-phosphate dehydrogenase [NAD(P)+]